MKIDKQTQRIKKQTFSGRKNGRQKCSIFITFYLKQRTETAPNQGLKRTILIPNFQCPVIPIIINNNKYITTAHKLESITIYENQAKYKHLRALGETSEHQTVSIVDIKQDIAPFPSDSRVLLWVFFMGHLRFITNLELNIGYWIIDWIIGQINFSGSGKKIFENNLFAVTVISPNKP